jgi:hypothetical protein
MDIHQPQVIYRRATLLLAAVVLQRTHGRTYAAYLLEEYGFAGPVIEELTGLSLTVEREDENGARP